MHGRAQELFDNSLFYRFREIDWVVILFVIATMFFKVIAMASTTPQRRGRNLRAVAVRGGVHGGFDRPAVQCIFRLGRLGRLVHAGGHGRRDVGRDEAPLTSIFLIAELRTATGCSSR